MQANLRILVQAVNVELTATATATANIKTLLDKSTADIAAWYVDGYNCKDATARLKNDLITMAVDGCWKFDAETGEPCGEKAARSTAGGKIFNRVYDFLHKNYSEEGVKLTDAEKQLKKAKEGVQKAETAVKEEQEQAMKDQEQMFALGAVRTEGIEEGKKAAFEELTEDQLILIIKTRYTDKDSMGAFIKKIKI